MADDGKLVRLLQAEVAGKMTQLRQPSHGSMPNGPLFTTACRLRPTGTLHSTLVWSASPMRERMVMFNPDAREQGRAFDFELERLSSLVADMRRIREGMPISELVGDA